MDERAVVDLGADLVLGGGCAKARPSPNKSSRAWGFDRMVFLVGLVADPSPSGASVGDARVAPAFGILAIVDVVVADIAVFGGVVAIAGLGGLLPAPEVNICPVVAGAAWGKDASRLSAAKAEGVWVLSE